MGRSLAQNRAFGAGVYEILGGTVGWKTASSRPQTAKGGSLTFFPPRDYPPFIYSMNRSYLGP
jgi:hypothetical protein